MNQHNLKKQIMKMKFKMIKKTKTKKKKTKKKKTKKKKNLRNLEIIGAVGAVEGVLIDKIT